MAATATLSTKIPVDATQDFVVAQGAVVLTGNYPAHGDTLDLSKLGIPSNAVPVRVEVFEQPAAGTDPSGYQFIFCLGTTQANGVLAVFNGAATPFTTGAYNAALLAATLGFRAWFQSFV